MTLVRDMVEQVRSVLMGGATDELSVLDTPYTVGDGKIALRYVKRNIQPGGMVCVGLNTFFVLAVSTDGRTLTVLPSVDGGPEVNVAAGEIVRFAPRFSTWAIFREWNNELSSMDSPQNGLYAFGSFESAVNYQSGTYNLPQAWFDAGQFPIRLLIARYRMFGHTSWQKINAEWQADGNQVRIYGLQPQGTLIEFVFAFPFRDAVDLTTTTDYCGLNDFTQDIPGLGALETLSRGGESRRLNPMSQGDPRRASEVGVGASVSLAREWRAVQQGRINEELTRLQAQFGYQVITPSSATVRAGGTISGISGIG